MFKDISGNQYGRLTVLNNYKRMNRKIYWECLCECGNRKYINGVSLRIGKTKSCGCIVNKHKDYNDPKLYSIWSNMKDRCYNPNSRPYSNYGGRGITICEEWLNEENGFINFYNWAIGNEYKHGLSIDRIDNDGNYEPGNCQWLTVGENTAKANKNSPKNISKKKYWGISPDGNKFIFENANEFGRQHDLKGNSIRRVAYGDRKTYKQWKFGYVEEVIA